MDMAFNVLKVGRCALWLLGLEAGMDSEKVILKCKKPCSMSRPDYMVTHRLGGCGGMWSSEEISWHFWLGSQS